MLPNPGQVRQPMAIKPAHQRAIGWRFFLQADQGRQPCAQSTERATERLAQR